MDVVYGALVFAGLLWLTRSWPPSAQITAWLRKQRPTVLAYLRSAPAVVTYTAILIVTTSIYAETTPTVGRLLLRDQSTNLRQLSRDPIRALISSAFWTGGRSMLYVIVPFILVLVPMERWLGTARFVFVYWCGHIATTVIVAVGIWVAINRGDAPDSLSRAIDVGVSYGFYCCCALFTYRLPSKFRIPWVVGLAIFGLYGILEHGDFTSYGHMTTILIGFALYPVTRAPEVRRRSSDPIWGFNVTRRTTAPAL